MGFAFHPELQLQQYMLCGMCLSYCRLMLLFIALTLLDPGATKRCKKLTIP